MFFANYISYRDIYQYRRWGLFYISEQAAYRRPGARKIGDYRVTTEYEH